MESRTLWYSVFTYHFWPLDHRTLKKSHKGLFEIFVSNMLAILFSDQELPTH